MDGPQTIVKHLALTRMIYLIRPNGVPLPLHGNLGVDPQGKNGTSPEARSEKGVFERWVECLGTARKVCMSRNRLFTV